MAPNDQPERSRLMESSATRCSVIEADSEPPMLVVRRPVYEAAQHLRQIVKNKGGCGARTRAIEYVERSSAAGNKKAVRFWSEVHLFVVLQDQVQKPLQITEDQDNWINF